MIPKKLWINNSPLPTESYRDVPLACGADHWRLWTRSHGPLVVQAWLDTRWSDWPFHVAIFRTDPHWSSPPLKLRWQPSGMPYLLGPLDGYGWVDDSYLAWWSREFGSSPNPYDALYTKAVMLDATDPDVTHHTGSSNRDNWQAESELMRKHGVSVPAMEWLWSYLLKQERRPRWNLNANGTPSAAPVHNFAPWRRNHYGLNAWDAQHLDGNELRAGWSLTQCPVFLFALLQLWETVKGNAVEAQMQKPNDYLGSPRSLGYWLTLTSQLAETLMETGSPEWGPKIKQCIEQLRWHVANHRETFPIYTRYGSVPESFRDADGQTKPHLKTWMYAPVAWGLQEASHTAARRAEKKLANEAREAATALLHWIETYHWHPERGFRTAHTEDVSAETWAHPPGTVDWWTAPFVRADAHMSGAGQFLVDFWRGWGADKPSHPYFLNAVNAMAPLIRD